MITKEFVLAGRAIFTVEYVRSTGAAAHKTFRVTTPRRSAGDVRPPVWFVSVLTGPENRFVSTSSYAYLGMVDPATGDVALRGRTRFVETDWPVKLVRRVLRRVWAIAAGEPVRDLPPGWDVRHSGRCGRCGRVLTVPASLDSGIGPECAALMGASRQTYVPPFRSVATAAAIDARAGIPCCPGAIVRDESTAVVIGRLRAMRENGQRLCANHVAIAEMNVMTAPPLTADLPAPARSVATIVDDAPAEQVNPMVRCPEVGPRSTDRNRCRLPVNHAGVHRFWNTTPVAARPVPATTPDPNVVTDVNLFHGDDAPADEPVSR